MGPNTNMSEEWHQGLYGCFGDIGTCVYGYFCFPCMYGAVSEKVFDQGCVQGALGAWCCGPCICCCWGAARRGAIRDKLHLGVSPLCHHRSRATCIATTR